MRVPKFVKKAFNRPSAARSNQAPQASAASRVSQSTPAARPPRMKTFAGSITELPEKVGAFVNAANAKLQAGDGVCGAIFEAAKPDDKKLQKECFKQLKRGVDCPVGGVKITSGKYGSLNCDHVIHAVAPDCREADQYQNRKALLTSAYRNAIKLADDKGCKSIAIPALSTGIFKYDLTEATKVAVETVSESLKTCKNLKEVIFCCFETETKNAYDLKLAEGDSASSGSAQSNVVDIPSRFASRPNLIASTDKASLENLSINPRNLPQIPPQLSITGTSIIEINDVDAIVNPTDTALSCGGIVSEQIVEAFNGNDNFQKSIKKLNCKPEDAVMDDTKFGASQVKVVHVAGPTFNSDDRVNSMKSLASTYQAAIKLADKNGCKSIAIPAISTGAQGFPVKESAMVAVTAVNTALKDCDNLHKVQFCYFGANAKAAYESALKAVDTGSLKPAAKPSPRAVQEGNSKHSDAGLSRFHDALANTGIQNIKDELEGGKKEGHWMWFAFPQISGLSQSETAEKFELQGLDGAKEFLNDSELEDNLRKFTSLAMNAAFEGGKVGSEGLKDVFGEGDAQKFHACITVFAKAEEDSGSKLDVFFQNTLNALYQGEAHEGTDNILKG